MAKTRSQINRQEKERIEKLKAPNFKAKNKQNNLKSRTMQPSNCNVIVASKKITIRLNSGEIQKSIQLLNSSESLDEHDSQLRNDSCIINETYYMNLLLTKRQFADATNSKSVDLIIKKSDFISEKNNNDIETPVVFTGSTTEIATDKSEVSSNTVPCSQYSLRTRQKIQLKPSSALNIATEKTIMQLALQTQSALCSSRALRLWNILKKRPNKIEVGQVVCARMSGYRPWPAKIEQMKKNGVLVRFYGTHDKGLVKRSELVPFELCKDVLYEYYSINSSSLCPKTLSYHNLFLKACAEVLGSCQQDILGP